MSITLLSACSLTLFPSQAQAKGLVVSQQLSRGQGTKHSKTQLYVCSQMLTSLFVALVPQEYRNLEPHQPVLICG